MKECRKNIFKSKVWVVDIALSHFENKIKKLFKTFFSDYEY